MNPTTPLLLRSPDTLLAATPHLLGFTPHDSVVIVGLAQHADGTRHLVLTQRLDTPSSHGLSPAQETAAAQDAARVMAEEAGADSVIVSVWASAHPDPDRELPEAAFVDRLVDAMDARGITTVDALYTDETRRWSYGCDDPACCDPAGVVIPEQTKTLMAAEFALEGRAAAVSRAALQDELTATPDPAVAAQIDRLRPEFTADRPDPARRSWREQQVQALHQGAAAASISAEQVARTALALADTRIRDTYLWDLGQPGAARTDAIAALAQVVRRAPAAHVTPAATVLALQHYQGGDGARANIALDCALRQDPDYSLAHLARMSLTAGLPPAAFTQSLAELPRDTCLDPVPVAASAPTPTAHHTTPPQGIAL